MKMGNILANGLSALLVLDGAKRMASGHNVNGPCWGLHIGPTSCPTPESMTRFETLSRRLDFVTYLPSQEGLDISKMVGAGEMAIGLVMNQKVRNIMKKILSPCSSCPPKLSFFKSAKKSTAVAKTVPAATVVEEKTEQVEETEKDK